MLSLRRASAPAKGSGEQGFKGRMGFWEKCFGRNVPTGKNQDGKKSCDLLFRPWKLFSQRKTEGEGRKIFLVPYNISAFHLKSG